jgi:hypothetical protein
MCPPERDRFCRSYSRPAGETAPQALGPKPIARLPGIGLERSNQGTARLRLIAFAHKAEQLIGQTKNSGQAAKSKDHASVAESSGQHRSRPVLIWNVRR